METENGDVARRGQALPEAVQEALAEFPDEDRAAALGAVDYRWLSIGMRLAQQHPAQARHLLEMIGSLEVEPAALREGGAGEVSRPAVPATGSPDGPAPVPVRSTLLARTAALPMSQRATMPPEATFGWAAQLTPVEFQSLGRVVHDMLAAGSPSDIGRAFGIAWDSGVRLPRQEHRALFREFTELEVTVGGVLTGRDLRAGGEAPRPRGLGSLLDQWVTRARPEVSQADASLAGSGEPGQLGLVAPWNVWMAVRYQELIPRPTFELLVRPWEVVVGALPDREPGFPIPKG